MKKLFYILIFLFSALLSFSQRPFKSMEDVIANPPSPAMAVVDYTTTLTPDQQHTLESKIQQLYQSSSIQIEVVVVPSLDGMDVMDAAIELGRKWGVGNKKDNSGVVLLICTDEKNRKLSIAPGYGLEGALTDVESDNIINDVIVPNFKGKDYYRGISEGVDAIIQAVQGTYNTAAPKGGSRGFSFIPIIVIIVIIILLSSRGGGGRGGSFMSSRGAIPFIIGNMLGGGGGGGWSGGGGSSGGGGGFSGGFGGGSFGGGGSSGSW